MYTENLQQIGLSANQAPIYDLLIRLGSMTTADITKQVSMSRPLVYKTLDELEEMGFVVKEKKQSATMFSPTHPENLRAWVEQKTTEAQNAHATVGNIFDQMVSDYNLEQGRPSIRFVEGMKGVREVMDDTNSATEDVYTYVDTDSLEKYVGEINRKYVKQRKDKGVKKKIIMIDSPLAREKARSTGEWTEIRLVDEKHAHHFNATVNIYDGKLAYFTFTEKGLYTATVLYDQNIYNLHRSMFQALWEQAIHVSRD